ncbi:MAG: lactate utilization protein [Gemmatimonadota bacterium]
MKREEILGRIRSANSGRENPEHPGPFVSGLVPEGADPVEVFCERFEAVGGETVRVADRASAREWLERFMADFDSVSFGVHVPADLKIVSGGAPSAAKVGVSWASAAIAETGSIALSSRDGRRVQLLPPTHVVLVESDSIAPTLVDAMSRWRDDLPAAIGLHSGPSKSADIGQVMVQGVHGPGRLIAVVIDGRSSPAR